MPAAFFVALASYVVPSAFALEVGTLAFALVGAATALTVSSIFARANAPDALKDNSKASLSTGRDPVAPWQWIYGETRVGGAITFIATSESPEPFFEINGVLNMVITLAGHEVDSIVDVYANDEKLTLDANGVVTSGIFATFISGDGSTWMIVKKALGNETTQPFPLLVAQNCGWTDAHRQNGRAKIYVWMRFHRDIFARGVPKFTAVVRGRKVFDPRSGLTAWSDNPALCNSDWLTNAVGLGCVYANEIDNAQLIAAANTCDEAVSLAAGGTEKRYTMNGAFQVGGAPRDTLGRLLTAMNGAARFIGGRWKLYPAAYVAPTITLTVDDLRGALHIMPRVSRRDLCNGVKGIYQSPDNLWQPTDFPAVTNATYLADDQGERIWRELDLPFTDSTAMAQRIAKIELERVRQQISVEWPGKLTCYRLQPGDTVMVTLSRYGWSSKVFEVVATKLAFEGDADGISVGCDLVLRETASAVYDWNSGEETTVDPAPDTDLPDPFNVDDPINVAASSGTDELLIAGDGTIISRIRVRWDVARDAFVTSGGRVVVQYKKQAEDGWLDGTGVAGDATQVFLQPVEDGATYNVRVAFANQLGVRSHFIQVDHTVVGKTEPPADVTGFSVNGSTLTWSPVTDPDLWGYRLRFQAGTSRSWGDAVWLHGQGNEQQDVLTTPPFTLPSNIGVGAAVLLCKAVDLTGNESLNVAELVVNLGSPAVANVVQSFDRKAAGFPGTKTSCTVDGSGNLVADSTTLMWRPVLFFPSGFTGSFGSMWKEDSTALMWATSAYAQMSYEDRVVTAGARTGSKLTLSAAIQGDPWQIQYRENSTQAMWGADASAPMWDVSGSVIMWDAPPYITWPGQAMVNPDSMFDFLVTTGQGQTQGKISGFTATLDAPDLSEFLANVSISAGGTRLAPTKSYIGIKGVTLTAINDGGAAVSAKQEDAQATGPLVKTYDGTGAAVSGHVNARIEGF